MKRLIFLAALGGLLPHAISDAQASEQIIFTQTVHYSDLDLNTVEGRRVFDRRMLTAVQKVCGAMSSADLSGQNAARRCRQRILARAAPSHTGETN